uniref:Uncharacterized protein n=1 Tax=Aegilops tauschii subsp. strangulata TaxID=200361 RepID=A0A453SLY0_AEGTS
MPLESSIFHIYVFSESCESKRPQVHNSLRHLARHIDGSAPFMPEPTLEMEKVITESA